MSSDRLEGPKPARMRFFAYRFAEELGVEEEIWFLEYPQPQLSIWRKHDDNGER